MATIGRYETLRELNRHGNVSVWLAQVRGADQQVVVKIIRSDGDDSKSTGSDLNDFLEAAEIQKKLAESSKSWAPVIDLGRSDEGAYSVMPNLPRSLERLILGRARLDTESLYRLIRPVADGLVALEQAASRPHGNLKPSNVLLEETPRDKHPQVYLTDPVPGLRDLDRAKADDLKGIGLLIYELVILQPFRRVGGWPVPESPDWLRLGSNGPTWRALCNQLLDPDLAKKGLSLQTLVSQELPKLEPQVTKTPWGKLAAVGVLILVVGIGGFFLYQWLFPPVVTPDVDPQKWKAVCESYTGWIGKLQVDFQSHQIDAWKSDPQLNKILEQLGKGVEFDPRKIAGLPDAFLPNLANNPPPQAKDASPVRKTGQAYDAIQFIHDHLVEWPVRQRLTQAAAKFEVRGWKSQGDVLKRLGALATPGDSPRLAEEVNHVRDQYAQLGGDAYFNEIEKIYTKVAQGQPAGELSQAYSQYVTKYLDEAGRSAGLESLVQLQRRLRDLADLHESRSQFEEYVTEIAKAVTQIRDGLSDTDSNLQKISEELDQIKGDYKTSLGLPASLTDTEPVRNVLANAQTRIKELRRLTDKFWDTPPQIADPRKDWDKTSSVDLATAAAQLEPYKESTTEARDLVQEIEDLQSRGEHLMALPWINRHRREIQNSTTEMFGQLKDIQTKTDLLTRRLEQPPSQPDPRLALEDMLRGVQQDVRELAQYAPQDSQRYEDRITRLQTSLDEVRNLTWIVANQAKITQSVSKLDQEVVQIHGEVFPLLDPRKYSQDKWLQQIRRAQEGILQHPDTNEARGLGKRLDQCSQDMNALANEIWTSDSRKHIEQSHRRLTEKLDQILKEVLVDPRERLDSQWSTYASRIQQARKFFADLGGRESRDFDQSWRQAEQLKKDLQAQPAPTNPREMEALNQQMTRIEDECDTLFAELDPRKAWNPAKLFAEIEQGLSGLESKDPAKADKARQSLKSHQQEHNRINNLSWKWDSATELVNSVSGLREKLTNLRNTVITDPREQIGWDTIVAQLGAELKSLDRQDASVGRDLAARFKSIQSEVTTLRSIPWQKDREQEIQGKVAEGKIALRSLYIDAISAQPHVEGAASAAADAIWVEQRKILARDGSPLESLQKKVNDVRDQLTKICDQFPATLPEAPRPRGWDGALAQQKIATNREAAIQKVLQGWRWDPSSDTPQPQPPGLQQAAAQYKRWHKDINRLLEDFKTAEQALDQAYGLDETPGQGPALTAVVGYWFDGEGQPLYQQFAAAIGDVKDRLESLRQIAKANDRRSLLALARKGKAALDPAVTVAAWRRLSTLSSPTWPADLDELNQEFEINRELTAMILGRIDDTTRKTSLQEEISREQYRRWLACFTRLASASQPPAQQINDAVSLFIQAGMDWQNPSIPTWAKFNLIFSEFQTTIDRLKPGTDDALAKENAQVFVARAGLLIPQGIPAQSLVDGLNAVLSGSQSNLGLGGLSKAGPRASMVWNDDTWTDQADPQNGKWIEYTWSSPSPEPIRLRFVRVEGNGRVARPFYVCTTEVSLGLFKEVVDAAGSDHWKKVDDLLGDFKHWRGPLVWRKKKKGLTDNKRWNEPLPALRSSGGKYADYAPNIKPGKPDETYPMQYVSADAALYFASLLGCRLPTSTEWALACEAELAGRSVDSYVTQVKPNLRDSTWFNQYDYFKNIKGQLVESSIAPYSGSFWKDKSDRVWRVDDGVLWFVPVSAGNATTFQNIIGNVAEWVLDGSTYTPQDALADVSTVLRTRQLGVIGGSSQSPPSNSILAKETAQQPSEGSSDVGIRLTFSSPSPPLVSQVRQLLAQQQFLSSSQQ